MKTVIVFVTLLFATAALAQDSKTPTYDEQQIERSIDSAVASLDKLDKDGKLSQRISQAVEAAMKQASKVLAEAQGELKQAENAHTIDSALKASTEALKESKAALKAAAKALKNSDAIKHAGKAFDEAAKAFEQAMKDFEREFEQEMER